MLRILRIAAVVGAIFSLSPVRPSGEPPPSLDQLLAAAGSPVPRAAPAPAAIGEALWQAVPDAAKRALLDRALAPAAQGGRPEAAPAHRASSPAAPPALERPARRTLPAEPATVTGGR